MTSWMVKLLASHKVIALKTAPILNKTRENFKVVAFSKSYLSEKRTVLKPISSYADLLGYDVTLSLSSVFSNAKMKNFTDGSSL